MGPRMEASDDVAIANLERIAELARLGDEAEREGKTEVAETYWQMILTLLGLRKE